LVVVVGSTWVRLIERKSWENLGESPKGVTLLESRSDSGEDLGLN